MIVVMREISLHFIRITALSPISTNQEDVDSYARFILLMYSSSSLIYNNISGINTHSESVKFLLVIQMILNYVEVPL